MEAASEGPSFGCESLSDLVAGKQGGNTGAQNVIVDISTHQKI